MVPPEFHGHELCVIAHSRSKGDRKSTRLNSSHDQISYAVFCLKKKKKDAARQAARGGADSHVPHPSDAQAGSQRTRRRLLVRPRERRPFHLRATKRTSDMQTTP